MTDWGSMDDEDRYRAMYRGGKIPQDNEKNPAREAMIGIVGHMTPNRDDAKFRADWILLMLAERGFVVVPLGEK